MEPGPPGPPIELPGPLGPPGPWLMGAYIWCWAPPPCVGPPLCCGGRPASLCNGPPKPGAGAEGPLMGREGAELPWFARRPPGPVIELEILDATG